MIRFDRIRNYLELVRFSHTIFALPFILMGAMVAARGIPRLDVMGWILLCAAAARTSAMTFNRVVDRHIDSLNPRTKDRHLPSGLVNLWEAVVIWGVSSLLFFFGAWMLNPLAFFLSFPTLVILCGYSFWKRFSCLSHFVLGLSLGIAPVGAWIAVRGTLDPEILPLMVSVLFWVAGFDIIYALLDEEFDRRLGLHSIVVRFGKIRALQIAFALHGISVIFAALFGWTAQLGWIYYLGTAAFAGLILYEHSLVSPQDITRVNIAFFTVNGVISAGLFLCAATDLLLF